jgi:phage FluMu protein Com
MVELAPEDAYDDHVLVHCPKCDRLATIGSRSGYLRITCPWCAFAQELRPRSEAGRPLSLSSALAVYNDGNSLFGARLWLETECCGGQRLWALNERHLEYLEAFVRSTDRTREFPSDLSARQLGERLPTWMVTAKHRDEVLRKLDQLRATL